MKKIKCSILTPDRYLYEGEVAFAVVQAHNGEMGFLVDHAPLISELGIGEVRLQDGKTTEYFVVEGGVVEIRDNKLIIIAETASKKDELDKAALEEKLKELKEQKEREIKAFSPEWVRFQGEEKRVKARIKVASR
ncbi:MAG TPA: ATP synthase F1 subunit epsilon [Spirochaetota bacterium]|jgi:F-type H+-transporting ATPase subunit epsilon|nr:ATP synthase F1 subunit epsilon [Spirochaetota bacterium]HOT45229.1 ATP synthase F1 subunit epsilon [Spirochaetota bacterium]HPC42789.1 ATP synthase F1 subunit epsilon [Spirochaetota bacterium]HPL15974.1 ATP synthase F1 subunit epsilon [Spirochaetota bacterium]HPV42557.1 ATP synthase F1 subunit epsilon [Spirochaetota bacterium]